MQIAISMKFILILLPLKNLKISHPIAICMISEIDKKLKNRMSPTLFSIYSSYNYILLLTARYLKKTAQQKITIFDAYVSLKASTILGD